MAGSASDELAALDALLAGPPPDAPEMNADAVRAEIEKDAAIILAELRVTDPEDVVAAERELRNERPSDGYVEEVVEGLSDVPRYLRWAALFGKRRLSLTRTLI